MRTHISDCRQAAQALRNVRAVESLIAALKDKNEFVRISVAVSLRNIAEAVGSRQSFWDNPIDWQEWWEKNKVKVENLPAQEKRRTFTLEEEKACKDMCMEMSKRGELRQGVTLEECVRALCK